LADDVILSYHISLLKPLLYLCVWLLPAKKHKWFRVHDSRFLVNGYFFLVVKSKTASA